MRTNKTYCLYSMAAASLFLSLACGPDQRIMQSGKETPAPSATTDQRTTTEQELASMRNAGFSYIYVLRRKDGAPHDTEDKNVIRQQTYEANRRVSAEDGRAILVGSNFQITVTNMKPLSERFAVQDFSAPPPEQPPGQANANVNK